MKILKSVSDEGQESNILGDKERPTKAAHYYFTIDNESQ